MRILAWAVVLPVFSSCASQMIASRISRDTGCPSAQIVVGKQTSWAGPLPAKACDRDFFCFIRSAGYSSWAECEETASSKAAISEKVVAERLSLETGCPKAKVHVAQRSEWSAGGETAFRMVACERPYLCAYGPGRVECKPAMGGAAAVEEPARPPEPQDPPTQKAW